MQELTAPLFEPFTVRGLHLPNRTIMAPMGRMFARKHVPHEQAPGYYARRILGGVGLVMTEATGIDHPHIPDHPGIPVMFGEDALAAWRQVVERVHSVGGLIIPQLFNQGMLRGAAIADHSLPSLRPSGTLGEPGSHSYHPEFLAKAAAIRTRPMTESDIQDVIAGFVRSAMHAKNLGFDGIAIHGAHGYLIDSFLWGASNTRSDRYGGDHRQRTLFAVEIVRAVRRAIGEALPIFFRFSQHKSHNYDARLCETPGELEAMLGPIADAGVDVLDASIRRFYQPAFEGSPLNLAGWTKKLTGKPTIAVGSVGLGFTASDTFKKISGEADNNIPLLMERFNSGEFDLISIGRSLIADPDFVKKLRTGEPYVPFSREALDRLE
jgi:2,4-dienoyl-CoA reductase-like NADH-dependent reductase (Old Yellow Enzyme family)